MNRRILLTGGSTGGSVTPLIALADELRRRWPQTEFYFVGSFVGPEKVLAEQARIPFQAIPSGKLRRYWSFRNFSDVINIWRGWRQAKSFLRAWHPDVVVSAGSFVSVPVIWAAHQVGIPTVVHQQDVRPGLANRLMASSATAMTVVFQKSIQDFPGKRVRWIGNPVRPEILQGSEQIAHTLFGIPTQVPTILVLGGGTGSAMINTTIGSMAHQITQNWFILHVIGATRHAVGFHDPHYRQFPFLTNELPHALAIADVVISRTGLGSITELAALSKPTIFIPIPNSHQEDNARVIAEAGAGIVLKQTPHLQLDILAALQRLRQNPQEAIALGEKLHTFYAPDATKLFADEVMSLVATT